MRPFSKKEIIVVLIILFGIGVVSFKNFQISLRRARDAQRKADLGRISNALNDYHEDFGFYPPSLNGKIVACKKQDTISFEDTSQDLSMEERLNLVFRPCEWGKDALRDVSDPKYPVYIDKLPQDPKINEGRDYIYFSNLSRLQLYASLEGQDEAEYQEEIAERGLSCGEYICNYGKSSGATPLDKSIEKYENELEKKKR